jgi:hypothetical protein
MRSIFAELIATCLNGINYVLLCSQLYICLKFLYYPCPLLSSIIAASECMVSVSKFHDILC